VKCFDGDEFQGAVQDEVHKQRAGNSYFASMDLAGLKRSLDWSSAQRSFLEVLARMAAAGPKRP
jgi:hypothetical protein